MLSGEARDRLWRSEWVASPDFRQLTVHTLYKKNSPDAACDTGYRISFRRRQRRGADVEKLEFTTLDGLSLPAEVGVGGKKLGNFDLANEAIPIPADRLEPYDQIELRIAPRDRTAPLIIGLSVVGDDNRLAPETMS